MVYIYKGGYTERDSTINYFIIGKQYYIVECKTFGGKNLYQVMDEYGEYAVFQPYRNLLKYFEPLSERRKRIINGI